MVTDVSPASFTGMPSARMAATLGVMPRLSSPYRLLVPALAASQCLTDRGPISFNRPQKRPNCGDAPNRRLRSAPPKRPELPICGCLVSAFSDSTCARGRSCEPGRGPRRWDSGVTSERKPGQRVRSGITHDKERARMAGRGGRQAGVVRVAADHPVQDDDVGRRHGVRVLCDVQPQAGHAAGKPVAGHQVARLILVVRRCCSTRPGRPCRSTTPASHQPRPTRRHRTPPDWGHRRRPAGRCSAVAARA